MVKVNWCKMASKVNPCTISLAHAFHHSKDKNKLFGGGGITGGGSEVAARALSLPDLNQAESQVPAAGLEIQEQGIMEQEICRIDRMIEDMEKKVNVLRWMVEPHGPQYPDPVSSPDSASLALLSVDEEQPGNQSPCTRRQVLVLFLLFAVVLLATALSASIVFFS